MEIDVPGGNDSMWVAPSEHVDTNHPEEIASEGDAKLRQVREQGPTPEAFTFAKQFPPP